MTLKNNHLDEIKEVLRRIPSSPSIRELSEYLAKNENLEQISKRLNTWLRTNQMSDELLPARRAIAYNLAASEYEGKSDKEIIDLSWLLIYPKSAERIIKTVNTTQDDFLKGHYICINTGTTVTVMDLPQTELFPPVLTRKDISQAIAALRNSIEASDVTDSQAFNLDNHTINQTTVRIIESFEDQISSELSDEAFHAAVIKFLASLSHRFYKTGYTGAPQLPANIFCAQLAWVVTDKSQTNAIHDFWSALYPELDLTQSLASLPRYGEAILDSKLVAKESGQLIDYRQCYENENIASMTQSEQRRIRNFHPSHSEFWAGTLNPRTSFTFKNYCEFFTSLVAFLDKYRSDITQNLNIETEESISVAAQEDFQPYQIQMLAFKQVIETGQYSQNFSMTEGSRALLGMIRVLTLPAQESYESCFHINYIVGSQVLQSVKMRAFLTSIQFNPARIKHTHDSSESLSGQDRLTYLPEHVQNNLPIDTDKLIDIIQDASNEISMQSIAEALDLKNTEEPIKKVFNVVHQIQDLYKKQALYEACFPGKNGIGDALSDDLNEYTLAIKLCFLCGYQSDIKKIKHAYENSTLNYMFKLLVLFLEYQGALTVFMDDFLNLNGTLSEEATARVPEILYRMAKDNYYETTIRYAITTQIAYQLEGTFFFSDRVKSRIDLYSDEIAAQSVNLVLSTAFWGKALGDTRINQICNLHREVHLRECTSSVLVKSAIKHSSSSREALQKIIDNTKTPKRLIGFIGTGDTRHVLSQKGISLQAVLQRLTWEEVISILSDISSDDLTQMINTPDKVISFFAELEKAWPNALLCNEAWPKLYNQVRTIFMAPSEAFMKTYLEKDVWERFLPLALGFDWHMKHLNTFERTFNYLTQIRNNHLPHERDSRWHASLARNIDTPLTAEQLIKIDSSRLTVDIKTAFTEKMDFRTINLHMEKGINLKGNYYTGKRIIKAIRIYQLLAHERILGNIRYSVNIEFTSSMLELISKDETICRNVLNDDNHSKLILILETDPLFEEAWTLAGIADKNKQFDAVYKKAFEQNIFNVSNITGSPVIFSSTLANQKLEHNLNNPGKRTQEIRRITHSTSV